MKVYYDNDCDVNLIKGKKVAVRDHFIIHLALTTGLRVMEISALNCGDIFLDDKICSVFVRKGKGNKKRVVYFTGPFRKHCRQYLRWKQQISESIGPQEPLIVSSKTGSHISKRAIETYGLFRNSDSNKQQRGQEMIY